MNKHILTYKKSHVESRALHPPAAPSVSFRDGMPPGTCSASAVGVMGVEGHEDARVLPPVRSPGGQARASLANGGENGAEMTV